MIIMVAEIESRHPENTPRDILFNRFSSMEPVKKNYLMHAHSFAEVAHAGQKRSSDEPYITHPENTTIILIDLGVEDENTLGGGLLHDVIEDNSDIFPDKTPEGASYEEWKDYARNQMQKLKFSRETANIVISLTKPKIGDFGIESEEERRQKYAEILMGASPEALVVKMADRLHNLRTLSSLPLEKKRKVITETQHVYLKIFGRVEEEDFDTYFGTYSEVGKKLLARIRDEVQKFSEYLLEPESIGESEKFDIPA